jgi:cytochrome c-type biogenesis protein CcmH/NrfG
MLRSRRIWAVAGAAAAVGVGVALVSRAVAGGSCPVEERLVPSSCGDLVEDLSVRMGGIAAFAVVFMQVLSTGLLKTWSAMEQDRLEDEQDAPVSSR